jgi:stage II sporulation protein D
VRRIALCLPIALIAALPAPAGAAGGWVIEGRGWGHGVGMSQYGAYGYAKHGAGYRRILSHYYKGTSIGRDEGRVRVLIGSGGTIQFSDADRACGERLRESKGYQFERSGGGIALARRDGRELAQCGRTGGARGGRSVRYEGRGEFRGELVAVPAGDGLYAVNRIGIDDYVQGVVPNEMPSSWPADALRTQAVAARSYALSTAVDGDGFDLYDDTRSQVYDGLSSETAATNRAVEDTAGEVIEAGGRTAVAFYFSTSGGETESSQYGFAGGTPHSYLKGVRDPYDGVSPYHRWRVTMSQGEIEDRLGSLVAGRLRRIEVVKTGVSPRIVRARVVGSGGKREVTGQELQSELGLRSTWARFKKR